jgi:hypothetical protein
MGKKNERIKELEELVEHQRDCIDWLKAIVVKLADRSSV